ncbi:MAG: glucokinase [Burkholderiaceae bacterium]|nr:glucokinase [Burkholderiaceae bacterium]
MKTQAAVFPWLVADIGGTNARFGLISAQDAAVEQVISVRCADYATPEAAACAYLAEISRRTGAAPRPRIAAFALATAVNGDIVRMTNSPWTVSAAAARNALGAERVILLNDFEALALALPRLAPMDVMAIGGGLINHRLPMAVIGPGTGLGVAACVPTPEGGWVALPSEGGHVTLAAADDFEADVLRIVRGEHAHVSAERLLSGLGLPLLYRAVATVRGQPFNASLAAPDITRLGLQRSDASCTEAVDTFCAMLGGFAGNVALTVGARGGLLVAGGVAHTLRDYLPHSRFRERFEAKGRFRGYLAPIATGLVIAPHAALAGAGQGIANQVGSPGVH